MTSPGNGLFDPDTWTVALDTYAAVANVTVVVYDEHGKVVLEPIHRTVLFELFAQHGYDPGLFAACVRRCSVDDHHGTPTVVEDHGLAVVGIPLRLDHRIVGAAVGGYVLSDFPQPDQFRRLSRTSGIPFEVLWKLVRTQQPMPQRRLLKQFELLRVLGDSLLRENARTRREERHAVDAKTDSASKDDFLAVLSHELRSPLTPILGWAQLLKKMSPDPATLRRGLDSIEQNARRQKALVEDVLDFNYFRRGSVELDATVLDLHRVTRTAVEPFIKAARRKKILLEALDAGDPIWVKGDANRLQHLFRNLLSNAVKFTPAGGRIIVRVGHDADGAVVTISDSGQGISREFLPSVFEMFKQERMAGRAHPGLGIGLAVVKQIADLHGGTVTLTSPGARQGTEVTVRLPRCVAPTGGPEVTPRRAGDARFQDLTILIVDDLEDAREILRLLVESHGARAIVAADGVEALSQVAAESPDVVLCDLQMPVMDGIEFVARLRLRDHPQPPVIAVSAAVSDTDKRRTRIAGFAGHLNKPYDDAQLVAAINAARPTHRRSA